jgi:hypothetical protein
LAIVIVLILLTRIPRLLIILLPRPLRSIGENTKVYNNRGGVGVYTVMVCWWTDHILVRNPLLEVEADLSW